MTPRLVLQFSRQKPLFSDRWRRLFGLESQATQLGIAQLADAFDDASQNFEFWRSISRATTDVAAFDAPKTPANVRRFQTATAAFAQKSNDVADNFALFERDCWEKTLFLVQTFVAQTIFAVLDAAFELSASDSVRLFGATPFDWGNSARPHWKNAAQTFASELFEFEAGRFCSKKNENPLEDPFGDAYARLFPAELRRALGEFYTPPRLAAYLIDRTLAEHFAQNASFPSVLDPTCGGGVFLTTVLRKRATSGDDPAVVLNDLVGFDLSPLAVLTSRARLIFAATADVAPNKRASELRRIENVRKTNFPDAPSFPVFLCDALRDRVPKIAPLSRDFFDSQRWEDSSDFSRRFDLVLGNPPWISWDKLSASYREETKIFWRRYGLFNLSANEARFGGGKKELASLLVYSTIDRRLKNGGVLAFVAPKSLFQTQKSGDGFRRFAWNLKNESENLNPTSQLNFPQTTQFRLLNVDDFSEINVFPGVMTKVATFCVRKGEPTRYPIPARRWRIAPTRSASNAKKRVFDAFAEEGIAAPVSERLGAPLRFEFATVQIRQRLSNADEDERFQRDALVERILRDNSDFGARYVAKLGANAAGASGVFWLESLDSLDAPLVAIRNLGGVGRKKVETIETMVESALVFPLLRWRDVDEFVVRPPTTAVLLPQNPVERRGINEKTMKRDFPAALAYLNRFEKTLRNRAAFQKFQSRAPFWSLYNVDAETFAPIKVVWRRMDSTLRAAVVAFDSRLKRPIIPQETLSTVAVASLEEADYLAAILNSTPIRQRVASWSVAGSKSFGSPGILKSLGVPRFDPSDVAYAELAALGRKRRLANAKNEK